MALEGTQDELGRLLAVFEERRDLVANMVAVLDGADTVGHFRAIGDEASFETLLVPKDPTNMYHSTPFAADGIGNSCMTHLYLKSDETGKT